MKVTIHTDGGSKSNGSDDSLAAYGSCTRIFQNDKLLERQLYVQRVDGKTNNQMEMAAFISALSSVIKLELNNIDVEIHTDSAYVMNGLTQWIPKWRENNWMTSNKQPVKNVDLWKKLDSFYQNVRSRNELKIVKVKAHAGHYENEHIDSACTWAMENLKDKEYKSQTDKRENADWKDVWN